MTQEKVVRIACKGADVVNLHELTYFQGELKSLSKENYERLKKEIINTGYGFPIKAWRDEEDDKLYIIGGHQTYRTLTQMELEGWEVPPLPISYTFAKDFFEAKRRVLQDISEYGHVEKDQLYAFMSQSNIEIGDLIGSFDIPQISLDVDKFRTEYFTDPIMVSAHERSATQNDPETPEQKEVRLKRIIIPEVREGDCIEVMKTFSDNRFDSLVTDPPYGLSQEPDIAEVMKHWIAGTKYEHDSKGFMGKSWDSFVPGPEYWREAFRVMKPGAHGVVFAGTRTADLMTIALRFAGFEIRDVVFWAYGSGFPKSLDIAKAIDKQAGHWRGKSDGIESENSSMTGGNYSRTDKGEPITPAAAAWQGWGTNLKPAYEPAIMVRKPIEKGLSIAENVLKYGTGAINIEASRIGNEQRTNTSASAIFGSAMQKGPSSECVGRWPANFMLSHNCDCELISSGGSRGGSFTAGFQDEFVGGKVKNGIQGLTYKDEQPEKWLCTEGCPVAILDGQSGQFAGGHGGQHMGEFSYRPGQPSGAGPIVGGTKDFGGASRFFYTSKVSKKERNAGLEALPDSVKAMSGGAAAARGETEYHTKTASGYDRIQTVKNSHPTVKPIKLMGYLCTMITPPGGIVLDPFCGSGSTGVAAGRLGFKFQGIEQNSEYVQIARHRFVNEMAMTDEELGDEDEEEDLESEEEE